MDNEIITFCELNGYSQIISKDLLCNIKQFKKEYPQLYDKLIIQNEFEKEVDDKYDITFKNLIYLFENGNETGLIIDTICPSLFFLKLKSDHTYFVIPQKRVVSIIHNQNHIINAAPEMVQAIQFTGNNEFIVVEGCLLTIRNLYSNCITHFSKQNFITSFYLSNSKNNIVTVENADKQGERIIRIHNTLTMNEHAFHIQNHLAISSACLTYDDKYVLYSENDYSNTNNNCIKIMDINDDGHIVQTIKSSDFITQLHCISQKELAFIAIYHRKVYVYLPCGNVSIILYAIEGELRSAKIQSKELFKSKNEINISCISHDKQYLFVVETVRESVPGDPQLSILSRICIENQQLKQIYKTNNNITEMCLSRDNLIITEDTHPKGNSVNVSNMILFDWNGDELFKYINTSPIANVAISYDSQIISFLNEDTIHPHIQFIYI